MDSYSKAVDAYKKLCDWTGEIFCEPSPTTSQEKDGVFYLYSHIGSPLGRYWIAQDKFTS